MLCHSCEGRNPFLKQNLSPCLRDRVGGASQSPSSHTTVRALSHTAVLVKRLPVVVPSPLPG